MRRFFIALKRTVLFVNGLVAAAEYVFHGAKPRPGLMIFSYHRVAAGVPRWPPYDPFNVDPVIFRAQLEEITRLKRVSVVSIDDVAGWIERGDPPHGSYLLLTFDDGWQHLVDSAAEMDSRGIRAVAFVSTGHLGRECFEFSGFDRWYRSRPGADPRLFKPLDLLGCRELLRLGVDVQPHGHTHRSLGNLPEEEMRKDISTSIDVVRRRLKVAVVAFAYPYGTAGLCDATPRVEAALRASGVRFAVRSDPGLNRLPDLQREACRLRRISITDLDVGLVLRAKASGYVGMLPLVRSTFHGLRRASGFAPIRQ
jgi:peptidoglycan/xylan/chitin deacetylase (PgdA/CDA1 family)